MQTVIPDLAFEAAVLRGALLIGVVHERDVITWADEVLASATEPNPLVGEVSTARPELSAVRETLRPVAEPASPGAVRAALLGYVAADATVARRSMADRLRTLTELRREGLADAASNVAIKAFEDRAMLAAAGVAADHALASDFEAWLASVGGRGYHRVPVGNAEERAALLGALSRKVVRNRRVQVAADTACRAWTVASPEFAEPVLVLRDTLWQVAVAEFSPLPVASRIAYPALPSDAVLVLDEETAEPMGAREAKDRLAVG